MLHRTQPTEPSRQNSHSRLPQLIFHVVLRPQPLHAPRPTAHPHAAVAAVRASHPLGSSHRTIPPRRSRSRTPVALMVYTQRRVSLCLWARHQPCPWPRRNDMRPSGIADQREGGAPPVVWVGCTDHQMDVSLLHGASTPPACALHESYPTQPSRRFGSQRGRKWPPGLHPGARNVRVLVMREREVGGGGD